MALTRAALLALLLGLAGSAGAQEVVHDPIHDLTLDAREPGRVALGWAAAEDSVGVRVTGHEVWRQEGPTDGTTAWTGEWVQLDALGADAEGYVDRRVTPGARYRYKVATQAVATDGSALPVAQARRESETAGPAEALFDHYVEVVSVTAAGLEPGPEDEAKLRVHRFTPGTGWARGPETTVHVGSEVGAEELDGDFRTGGTLTEATHDAGSAAHVRWRTKAGATREASASDVLPATVWSPPAARRSTPTSTARTGSGSTGSGSEPKTPGAGASGTTARPLPFPEPSKVGTVVGRKVLWEVSNETGYRITVYWAGPGSGQATLEPGESTVLRLSRGGTYDLSGKATDTDRIAGAEGRFSLQAGSRYRSTFRKGTGEPPR